MISVLSLLDSLSAAQNKKFKYSPTPNKDPTTKIVIIITLVEKHQFH